MNQAGYVAKVEGNKAHVMFKRMSECGDKCATCSSGCEAPPLILDIENTLYADVGDYVEVNMEDDTFFKFTFFAYVVPLVMMLVGIALGYVLTHNELISIFVGLAFLAIAYIILRIVNNLHVKKQEEAIKMIRILSDEEVLKYGL